jgi:hypothetical protein
MEAVAIIMFQAGEEVIT